MLYRGADWSFLAALLGTIASVVIFRGLIDVLAHRFIPAPTLYGAEDELKDEDVVSRRRVYYWRRKFRLVWRLFVLFAICVGVAMIYNAFSGGDIVGLGRHRLDRRRCSRRSARPWRLRCRSSSSSSSRTS